MNGDELVDLLSQDVDSLRRVRDRWDRDSRRQVARQIGQAVPLGLQEEVQAQVERALTAANEAAEQALRTALAAMQVTEEIVASRNLSNRRMSW
jgi:hypothetical protein